MSGTAGAEPAPPGLWDPEALWAKAVAYANRAVEEPPDSPWFPFLASLALEHLGRSVIADIHPVLLADPRDEENLFYAFGAGRKSRPRSIPAHTVFSRCVRFVTGFTEEMATSCNALAERRNEELHAAGLPFAALDTSAWLPRWYRSLKILCAARGVDLAALLGDAEAAVAARLLAEADAATIKAVKQKVRRASDAAAALTDEERADRLESFTWPAAGWRRSWESLTCPSCGAEGRAYGTLARTQAPRLENDEIIETEIYVRDSFMCGICPLELTGQMELDAADLAGSFIEQMATDPDEYYGVRYAAEAMIEDYGND
jgi:hypothetical protein